jgi:hypothetical protein
MSNEMGGQPKTFMQLSGFMTQEADLFEEASET